MPLIVRLGTAFLMCLSMMAGNAQAAAPVLTALPGKVPEGAVSVVTVIHGRHSVNKTVQSAVRRMTGAKADPVRISEFQWPGTYIEAEFTGRTVFIRFDNTTDAFTVAIDGGATTKIVKPGHAVYRIGSLTTGWHRLRVEKTDESQDAVGAFGTIWAAPGQKTRLSPARPRAIEFIGDSFTSGYGNTSPKRECSDDEVWATTDVQQAFGPLTAKHYDADYQINSFSGIGMVRNYGGRVGPHMPDRYPKVLLDGDELYEDVNWQPQIIVIALGGNDFSTPLKPGEKWASLEDLRAEYISRYAAFVTALRARRPGASFILMNYGDDEVVTSLAEVVKRLNAGGESRVAVFNAGSDFTQTGCDWHLDLKDDLLIRDRLIAYIDAHKDLWKGQ